MKPNTYKPSNEASAGIAAWALLVLLKGYKLLISPYFRGSCRFLPSCADYARDAVAHHGALRGTLLTVRRLIRCHPLCEGGHDPVPVSTAESALTERKGPQTHAERRRREGTGRGGGTPRQIGKMAPATK